LIILRVIVQNLLIQGQGMIIVPDPAQNTGQEKLGPGIGDLLVGGDDAPIGKRPERT
jgi:hypothetical protein